MKKYYVLAAVALSLSACASEPPKTFDQKLAEATTPADRKETLRLACLNEAEWPASLTKINTGGRHASHARMRAKNTPEINEMKSLCRQMDDLTTADAEEKLPPKELAKSCSAKVASKKEKGWTDHANRIARICTEMTGVKTN